MLAVLGGVLPHVSVRNHELGPILTNWEFREREFSGQAHPIGVGSVPEFPDEFQIFPSRVGQALGIFGIVFVEFKLQTQSPPSITATNPDEARPKFPRSGLLRLDGEFGGIPEIRDKLLLRVALITYLS